MGVPRILVISDDGVPTGYGRISMETNRRLVKRGFEIMVLSVAFDGILPPKLDGETLPYWVGAGQGRDWITLAQSIIQASQPDIVHVVQDAPYAQALYASNVDWSKRALVITSPVDGVPIHPAWVDVFKQADGMLTISQFGVEAHARVGVRSVLCRPGVDLNTFYRYTDAEREQARAMLGIKPGAFVLMTAAQNQGRKAIASMLQGFFAFAQDKPDARYLLDMDKSSPVGWDIPALCQQFGWDAGKLIFREDAIRRGLTALVNRYNCADAHAVLSFREGYGMPLTEAMACGVVSIALDYCSGTEICNDGKGVLVRPVPGADLIGTWGGAVDKVPDVEDFTAHLETLYKRPSLRASIAERGMAWARSETWDKAADAVQGVYERVMAKRAQLPTQAPSAPPQANPLDKVPPLRRSPAHDVEAIYAAVDAIPWVDGAKHIPRELYDQMYGEYSALKIPYYPSIHDPILEMPTEMVVKPEAEAAARSLLSAHAETPPDPAMFTVEVDETLKPGEWYLRDKFGRVTRPAVPPPQPFPNLEPVTTPAPEEVARAQERTPYPIYQPLLLTPEEQASAARLRTLAMDSYLRDKYEREARPFRDDMARAMELTENEPALRAAYLRGEVSLFDETLPPPFQYLRFLPSSEMTARRDSALSLGGDQ